MDPVDRSAVVDLLGVLAYAELTAFDRLAEDARLAPTLAGRAALARMAAAEIGHHVPAHRPADRARGRPGRGDGAVRLRARRLPRGHPARAPGWRAWSRPTSATGWPPTSTARSPRSCPTPTGRWCSRCSPTPATPTSPSGRCGRRSPPTASVAGRLALWGRRLVGRGDHPVAGGHRRARRAGRADHDRHGRPRRRRPPDRADHRRAHPADDARWACAADRSAPAARPAAPPPLLSAHRGGAGDDPGRENTRDALVDAVPLECEYVEIDVQRCRGGVHVALPRRRRAWTATGEVPISTPDLRRVQAATPTPTSLLDEALEVLRGRKKVHLDLKFLSDPEDGGRTAHGHEVELVEHVIVDHGRARTSSSPRSRTSRCARSATWSRERLPRPAGRPLARAATSPGRGAGSCWRPGSASSSRPGGSRLRRQPGRLPQDDRASCAWPAWAAPAGPAAAGVDRRRARRAALLAARRAGVADHDELPAARPGSRELRRRALAPTGRPRRSETPRRPGRLAHCRGRSAPRSFLAASSRAVVRRRR